MNIWNKLIKNFNESLRNQYQGTLDNQDKLKEKIEAGKTVTVNAPTSMRTYTKGAQTRNSKGRFEKRSYTTGDIDIGDTTAEKQKKDYAKTGNLASTAIQSAKYDPKTNTATIRFQGGNKDYQYEVTPEEFQEFIDAPSKGQLVAKVWNHNPDFRKDGV